MPLKKAASHRLAGFFLAIYRYYQDNQTMPTITEMAHLSGRARSTAQRWLDTLEEGRLIIRVQGLNERNFWFTRSGAIWGRAVDEGRRTVSELAAVLRAPSFLPEAELAKRAGYACCLTCGSMFDAAIEEQKCGPCSVLDRVEKALKAKPPKAEVAHIGSYKYGFNLAQTALQRLIEASKVDWL